MPPQGRIAEGSHHHHHHASTATTTAAPGTGLQAPKPRSRKGLAAVPGPKSAVTPPAPKPKDAQNEFALVLILAAVAQANTDVDAPMPKWAARVKATNAAASDATETTTDEAATPVLLDTARQVFTAGADGLTAGLRSLVCSFLPWRECLAVRSVSQLWHKASEATIMITRLPTSPDTRAMFLACPRDVDYDTTTEAALRCKHGSKWRCQLCGFCNSESRILCGNRHCQLPCPTHRECARLFLGQLRREGTVPFVQWLVEGVMGSPANPVHIVNAENHRQLATGRGKGCAWIYLSDRNMAPTVLAYHHRVFADVHPTTGAEGVWIVKEADTEQLSADATARAGYDSQRSLVLPRCSLVVEFPSRQPYGANPDQVAAAAAAAPWATHGMDAEGAPGVPPEYASYAPPQFHQRGDAGGSWAAQFPTTDSPPSEEAAGDDKPAATAAYRRHEPYRSPVVAGTPAIPSSSPSPLAGGTPTPAGSFEMPPPQFVHDPAAAAAAGASHHQPQVPQPRSGRRGRNNWRRGGGAGHSAAGYYGTPAPAPGAYYGEAVAAAPAAYYPGGYAYAAAPSYPTEYYVSGYAYGPGPAQAPVQPAEAAAAAAAGAVPAVMATPM